MCHVASVGDHDSSLFATSGSASGVKHLRDATALAVELGPRATAFAPAVTAEHATASGLSQCQGSGASAVAGPSLSLWLCRLTLTAVPVGLALGLGHCPNGNRGTNSATGN